MMSSQIMLSHKVMLICKFEGNGTFLEFKGAPIQILVLVSVPIPGIGTRKNAPIPKTDTGSDVSLGGGHLL